MIFPKPFVKWAGGKTALLTTLEHFLPKDFDKQKNVTYIEPFVGGGAMLFHMLQYHKNIKKVVINDINEDLITCYKLIRESPQILIEVLFDIEKSYLNVSFESRASVYYAYRDSYNNNELTPVDRAAIFLFLNHTCFNGLYRVNNSGKFNVPIGSYKNPLICNKELIFADSELLNSVEMVILNGDYRNVRQKIDINNFNFIYFDPPYRPLSVTSYFKQYSSSPFEDLQQRELKEFCDTLELINCKWMLSNSDSKDEDDSSFFEKLYKGYNFQQIIAPRSINSKPGKKEKQTEALIRNYSV